MSNFKMTSHKDEVFDELDSKIGIDRIACVHINDSLNPLGAHKDRHANIGKGKIGLEALRYVVHHEKLEGLPMCLETPHIKDPLNPKEGYAPYKEEIALLR